MVRILIGVCANKKILNKKMIVLNYCLPAYDYRQWYCLLRFNEVSMEYPPVHLHLNIDVTKLNQDDIDWMKVNCGSQLIEIIPEIKKHITTPVN